ncbi:DUF3885 domain-containing protein [Hymenobacter jeollabukensis]|uniref:DUF3885 domain-containing protein n=1 Tax=Hymenobacter jeollabukensis TaxID=2025313 RepID=A0A5R8WWZ8_9BACT|nr:DUF3885 domain-containing protein [Hymenobacter jeollabukensis]TLM96583.1 DUF3885 domain-containing protein [Hymenobacter jeollabukensis]
MTAIQACWRFLADYFPGLSLRAPLFYNWRKALRFDLQTDNGTDTAAYFQEVHRRATALWEAVFAPTDTVLLVLMERRYRRGKIRFGNYGFRQIADLRRPEVSYAKAYQRYERDRFDVWNTAASRIAVSRLNYQNLLQTIANTDFPPYQPRLRQKGVLNATEIYLLNIDRKMIFHMYDDRGLDILATEIVALKPIYQRFNDWILEYDREEIDLRMSGSPAQ